MFSIMGTMRVKKKIIFENIEYMHTYMIRIQLGLGYLHEAKFPNSSLQTCIICFNWNNAYEEHDIFTCMVASIPYTCVI